jgi:hypothetical protein
MKEAAFEVQTHALQRFLLPESQGLGVGCAFAVRSHLDGR